MGNGNDNDDFLPLPLPEPARRPAPQSPEGRAKEHETRIALDEALGDLNAEEAQQQREVLKGSDKSDE